MAASLSTKRLLTSFLTRHLTWFHDHVAPALLVTQGVYNTARMVHWNDSKILFLFWNTDSGDYAIEWYPALAAPAVRVTFVEHHRPMCDGRPHPAEYTPMSILGAKLARCACPVSITSRSKVWLILPRTYLVNSLLTPEPTAVAEGEDEGVWTPGPTYNIALDVPPVVRHGMAVNDS